MATNAGEPYVNAHAQRKFYHLVLNNAAGTVTIDAANTDLFLLGKVEVVSSAIAGTVLTEQTYTGANGTTAFGIGILDGLAIRVSGYGVFFDNTIANGAIGATVAAVAAQGMPGVTTSGNCAVIATFVSTLAAKTGKAHIFLNVE